jgi:hypothetical protein
VGKDKIAGPSAYKKWTFRVQNTDPSRTKYGPSAYFHRTLRVRLNRKQENASDSSVQVTARVDPCESCANPKPKRSGPNGPDFFQAEQWEGASAPPTPSLPDKNKDKTFSMRVGGCLAAVAKDLEPCQIEQKSHYNRPEAVGRQGSLPKAKKTPPKPCYTQNGLLRQTSDPRGPRPRQRSGDFSSCKLAKSRLRVIGIKSCDVTTNVV